MGRDIETGEITMYFPEDSHYSSQGYHRDVYESTIKQFREFDEVARIICTSNGATILAERDGELGFYYSIWVPPQLIQGGLYDLHGVKELAKYRENYVDNGVFEVLGLPGRVIEAVPRSAPKYLLIDNGNVYYLDEGSAELVGCAQIAHSSRKQPNNDL